MNKVNAINAVIFKNHRILLIYSKKFQNWTLPGGKIEEGEEKFDALKRELMEELGVECRPVRLLCTTKLKYPEKFLEVESWLVEIFGSPENKEPDEHEKIEWFPLLKVPENLSDLAKDAIKEMLK